MGIWRGGVAPATATLLLTILGCSGGGSQPPDDGDPTTPPPAATWSKSLGGPGDDWANTVIATRDGGYLFAGVYDHQQTRNSGNPAIEGDVWVTKLDALGDTQWQQSLGEHRSGAAGAASVFRRTRAGTDGYWMVGTQITPGPSGVETNPDAVVDLLVARLNDDGSVRWTRAYDSGGFDSREFFYANETAHERGWDIVPTRDGGALVAAWSSGTVRADTNNNGVPVAAPWIVKIAATGDVQWNRRISETQYDYLAEEPAELLVRETAQNGAIVAASARVRGDSTQQGPKPAMQLTRIDSGGAVPWTQRYSRLIARDLIQVEEDLDGLSDDGFVIVGDDIAIWYVLDGDRDTIMMKFDAEDGTEDWRAIVEEGTTLESVVQVCAPTAEDERLCHYVAAGSARVDDEGPLLASAIYVTDDGDIDELRFYNGERATSVRVAVGGAADGRLQMVGYLREGGTFSILVQPDLIEVDRNETDFMSALNSASGPPLRLESDGRIVAMSAGETVARLRVFAPDRAAVFDRTFGAASEFRGERAFGAIEVSDGYVVVGQSDSSGTTRHPATLVAKLQADGSVRWQNFLENLELFAPARSPYAAIAGTSDGGFVIAGMSDAATPTLGSPRAVKLDATGAVQWTSAPLDASGIIGSSVTGIYRAPDGSFYVIGAGTFLDPSTYGPWVTRIDAQGATVWQRQLRPVGLLTGGTIDGDGVVLAGVTDGAAAHVPWAARVSGSGDLQWMHTYEAGLADHEPLARIVSATGGGFFLAASHLVGTNLDDDTARVAAGRRNIVLIRLAADGAARWHRTYGALYDETLYGLAATSDGGAVFAGRSDSLGEGAEAWIVRLGPDGRVNEGCNALRTAEAVTNYSSVTATWEDDDFNTPGPRAFAAGVGSRTAGAPLQTIRNSVLARQCSGVARPDGGGTPPTGFRLSVVQGSPGSPGVVTSSPAGITCGTGSNTCEATYVANTSVILRIDPGARNRFQSWTGCDTSTSDQCIVTMDRDRSVTASFLAIDAPRLTLSVSGSGIVAGSGLNCANGSSGTCSSAFQPGQIVTLTATAGATETFTGWGGDCSDLGRASPIDIEMNRSRECSATFTGGPQGSPRVTVSLLPAPQAPLIGYVRSVPEGLTCGSIGTDCTQTFAAGATVRLDGVSTDGNYKFETFNCTGQLDTPGSRSVEFVIDGDVTCTGTFSTGIERLGLRIATDVGGGTPGRVYSTPASGARGLDCQQDCDRPFTRNEVVVLRAEPLPDKFFNGWSGCDRVTPDPLGGPRSICTVTMNRTRNVAALFSIQHIGQDAVRTLAVSFPYDSGAGTVRDIRASNSPIHGISECTPDAGRCEFGYDVATDVVLLIEPFGNNTLLQNEDCDTFVPASGGNPAECHVKMTADRGVVFGFGTINAAPVASIDRTPSGNVAVDQTIQFSAAGSTDDEGAGQLSYQWDFDSDGTIDSTAMEPAHAYSAAGTYFVRLGVTDRFGSIGLADTVVEVIAANAPPVATFFYSPAIPLVGESISFNARTSSDDGRIATYNWDFTNDGTFDVTGDVLSASLTQFAYNAAGTYVARLQVVDDSGQAAETTRSITVTSSANLASITLNIRGDGDGVVSYIPVVEACSKNGFTSEPTCVRQFPIGSQVLLRATAYTSVGSVLGDWVGCTSINASGTECTVNLTTNRTVTLFINR